MRPRTGWRRMFRKTWRPLLVEERTVGMHAVFRFFRNLALKGRGVSEVSDVGPLTQYIPSVLAGSQSLMLTRASL